MPTYHLSSQVNGVALGDVHPAEDLLQLYPIKESQSSLGESPVWEHFEFKQEWHCPETHIHEPIVPSVPVHETLTFLINPILNLEWANQKRQPIDDIKQVNVVVLCVIVAIQREKYQN